MRSCLSPDSSQAGLLRAECHGEVRVRAMIAPARKGVLLDAPADAESGRDLFHSYHAHPAIQRNRGRPGTKSIGINEDITANSLSGRAGNLRDPVDPLAAEIHGNGIIGRALRRRQNPHRTPQCQSLSLPPLGIHRRHFHAPSLQSELPAFNPNSPRCGLEDHQLPRERKLEHFGYQSRAVPEQPPGMVVKKHKKY